MTHHRYEACWIPGLNTDFDSDQALEIGLEWLAEADYPGEQIILLNAVKMTSHRRALEWAATRYRVVSPQSRNRPGGIGHAVLAVWPAVDTLEVGERLAIQGALCVIPGTLDDLTPWMSRTQAVNLADPDAAPLEGPSLPAAAKKALDSALGFDGHNGFLGAGGKERAISELRIVAALPNRPEPVDIESYALASGETDAGGAGRLRDWYERILQGRTFRGYRGEVL